jgi:hypothetical protein
MPRLVFKVGEQKLFLIKVKEKLNCNTEYISDQIGISSRSLRDWINEKIIGDKEKLIRLSRLSGISLPEVIETREDWWSGRVNGSTGAKTRFLKHGPVATEKGRILGGIRSQINRRKNPEYYKKLGCLVANDFKKPKKSPLLAEWIGIVLGDGALTKDQCQISLDLNTDSAYSVKVVMIIRKLFGVAASSLSYPKQGLLRIVVSGVKFVKMMNGFGLVTGNKVAHQVQVPEWIKNDTECYRGCIRGLFDTDGGSFTHTHWVKTYQYRHFGLTYTSASKPLLKDFENYLRSVDIKVSARREHLFIYSISQVKKFFKVIKPNNLKHLSRLNTYLSFSSRLN